MFVTWSIGCEKHLSFTLSLHFLFFFSLSPLLSSPLSISISLSRRLFIINGPGFVVLQRLITGLAKYHQQCYDLMKEHQYFPIEVDLSQSAFQYGEYTFEVSTGASP